MAYKVVVATLDGEAIEEVPPKNLQYSYTLNRSGALSFVMPTEHPKCVKSLLDPGKRELHVYREDALVWGGYLWLAQVEEGGDSVRFGGNDYLSRLDHRYIDVAKDYVNVDQFDIAWDLIDFTQGQDFGDLGIQRFSETTSGVLRERHYAPWERKGIGESLAELAAVIGGFDFEITPDKFWKTYYPMKGSSQKHAFETGKNIRGWGLLISGETVASEVTALGEGDGATMKISVRSDTPSLTEFGLMEDTVEFRDVNVQATLDAHAEEELRLRKTQQLQPQIQVYTDEPPFGAYAVGDTARLRIDHGYSDINDDFRITAITVAVSNEGEEAVGVYFGEEGQ